jgi:hypothetical protein
VLTTAVGIPRAASERVYIASEHDDALTRHDGRAY